MRLTYEALGVKLTGTPQVFYGCTRSKAKARAVRNKTYRRTSNPREIIFVDMTGPFPDILIRNRYWIGVVDYYSCYLWSFFTQTKLQMPKKME